MEGSFGTGELNDMQEWKVQICKFSRFIPVTGQGLIGLVSEKKGGTA